MARSWGILLRDLYLTLPHFQGCFVNQLFSEDFQLFRILVLLGDALLRAGKLGVPRSRVDRRRYPNSSAPAREGQRWLHLWFWSCETPMWSPHKRPIGFVRRRFVRQTRTKVFMLDFGSFVPDTSARLTDQISVDRPWSRSPASGSNWPGEEGRTERRTGRLTLQDVRAECADRQHRSRADAGFVE